MSKFADKLKHCHQNIAPSIGFRKSVTESETVPMLLIPDLTGAGEKNSKNAVKGGVDAAIVNSAKADAAACQKLASTLGDIPLGILFEGSNVEKIADYADSGCDFIIFEPNATLETIATMKSGNFLLINKSMLLNMVRAINELTPSMDGVLVSNENTAITIEFLLICKSYSDLLDKPLIASVNSSITNDELITLYESGIKGLIVPGDLPADRITGFKKVISELPKTIKQKTRRNALLPQLGSVSSSEDDEDSDDD
jgi:hypothetical protein